DGLSPRQRRLGLVYRPSADRVCCIAAGVDSALATSHAVTVRDRGYGAAAVVYRDSQCLGHSDLRCGYAPTTVDEEQGVTSSQTAISGSHPDHEFVFTQ